MKGFCDLGFAKIDTDRVKRRGFAEVVYSAGKDNNQLKKIIASFVKSKQDVLLTKLTPDKFAFLQALFPGLKYNPQARMAYYLAKRMQLKKKGYILVISAGTSDIPIAEEAAVTSQTLGRRVRRLYDVGVAGVHRLMHHRILLRKASVIIVVAGMEGALASLVSGLVRAPVIAVPTSCGYGANFAGLSALLTMLNSCSPGVAVVNIDNGFGAGYFASLLNG